MWVFLVREESVACQVFQDQQVHQESRDPLEQLEIKVLLVQSVFLVLMDLVVILVRMVLQDLTVRQAKTAFLDKEVLGETLVQRVLSVLRVFLDPLALLELRVMPEREESLVPEDLRAPRAQLERED